jgi:hypothetical protein
MGETSHPRDISKPTEPTNVTITFDPLQLLNGYGVINQLNATNSEASFDSLKTSDLYAAQSAKQPAVGSDSASDVVAKQDLKANSMTQDAPAKAPNKDGHPDGQAPAPTDKPPANPQTTDANPAKPPVGPPKQEVAESDHEVEKGETLEVIARKTLGPNASKQEILNYANELGTLNNITHPESLEIGMILVTPGQQKDGTYTWTDPTKPNQLNTLHPDGSFEQHNTKDGTSYTRTPDKHDPNSYVEKHTGPNPGDKFDITYTSGDGVKSKTTYNPDGSIAIVSSDGSTAAKDKSGNFVQDDANGKHISYDKASNVTTVSDHDGTITKFYGSDNHSEQYAPDGTKVSKYKDGSFKEEHTDSQGRVTTKEHYPGQNGSYTEKGSGPKPENNYEETYDSKTGTTVRFEAKGTDKEKTTTRTRDGKVTEQTKDGIKDLSAPADYTQIDDSKKKMNEAVKNHIPAEKQAQFHKDMADFEKRAKASNMPPEEVAKTYEQMSKMLNGKEEDCTVDGKNRAKLAETFIHQCAHPDESDQGKHNTCNETAVAERGFTHNPSKLAEIAATTAMTGQWIAPDGKVVQIDKESLKPGAEEAADKPLNLGDRSYATQILNVAMINDITQRRSPPEFYHQITPDASIPGDTGERLTDAAGNVLTKKVLDPKNGDNWITVPRCDPLESDWEINNSAKRILGSKDCMLDPNDASVGVDSINTNEQMVQRIQQAKDQGELPLIIAVDGYHDPIAMQERPGYGGHVVSIDQYDPNRKDGKTIHISNQYGKPYDKWVSPQDLFKNSDGDYAANTN